jgi:SAM-dependent methyltransferase
MLPDPDLSELGRFDAVLCTSSLHHFHDPMVLWNAVGTAAAPGACVLVQDLYRPESPAAAQSLVDKYSSDEPDVLRRDYFNSLCAAFTPDEVAAQLTAAGFDGWTVATLDDRHLSISGRVP